MYQPGTIATPPLVSFLTDLPGCSKYAGLPTSRTWEAAGRAVYMPVVLSGWTVVRRVWWANGAVTSGGATIAVGVYADAGYGPGAKLVSGSAVQGTATNVQFVDVTDTTLPPGLYWIALSSSSATSTTLFGFVDVYTTTSWDASYRFNEAAASPLPAAATPVESVAETLWLYGFATTSSP